MKGTLEHMELIRSRVREMDGDTLMSCIFELGGGELAPERNRVRAALLDVYEERCGGDELDKLLDRLGM